MCLSDSTIFRPLESTSYPRIHTERSPGVDVRRASLRLRAERKSGSFAFAVFHVALIPSVVLSLVKFSVGAFGADLGDVVECLGEGMM